MSNAAEGGLKLLLHGHDAVECCYWDARLQEIASDTKRKNVIDLRRKQASGQKEIDYRNATLYTSSMIKTFRHKGLQAFFETGSRAGIQPHHAARLRRQLTRLDLAKSANDMNVPGWRLHQLSTGHWSVWVNGNWRVTFTFEGTDAASVDYVDYH